jgi:hypothetical protein
MPALASRGGPILLHQTPAACLAAATCSSRGQLPTRSCGLQEIASVHKAGRKAGSKSSADQRSVATSLHLFLSFFCCCIVRFPVPSQHIWSPAGASGRRQAIPVLQSRRHCWHCMRCVQRMQSAGCCFVINHPSVKTGSCTAKKCLQDCGSQAGQAALRAVKHASGAEATCIAYGVCPKRAPHAHFQHCQAFTLPAAQSYCQQVPGSEAHR